MADWSRRKYPRYNVAHLVGFRAEMNRDTLITEVGTLGLGGCGFFADKRNPIYVTGSIVQCCFSFEGIFDQEIKVNGYVIYKRTFQNSQGRVRYFYGVEFLPGQEALLSPLIEYLESLEKEGKLPAAG